MFLSWDNVKGTQPFALRVEGDVEPSVASLIDSDGLLKSEQIGIIAPRKYLQQIADFYNTTTKEDFLAFYNAAVKQGILQKGFCFGLLHVDPTEKSATIVNVDRYHAYWESSKMVFPLTMDATSTEIPSRFWVPCTRDMYFWNSRGSVV